ncbi:macrophage mannose receptor 1-like isoform X2 [Cottoperca gobio]|uniref:Macrophage mannose receptor 1-like isoform X2 n=1 Tax=Cottoperca gobio TaxID=56716 RepID=A0A6J2Q1D4_COTGO|nr:macrophage mannose receptor 1-like isoform X2 [Cottoperca gobio]XP_029291084.1 macrophage mannose receptor 1-like isoform X2 [Cottoperca gobio]XP_029291085.1 macrophage mannose receptor 1-like isoform X2 [Cottoperca gobio]XP_029291086.1 macrophage mannose receptor 1-like isoform X2 [Cottoperca gobio]XP_029291087.1 macrophage mannose receptor 1-like isoform X2 [Cottoperca gobio]XP_029291088.1 macrophage mannose receptor 1-like isoform X2 [Cottoperca gobio]
MDVVLLLIMAAPGLCAVSSHAERQFHFIYDLKNMTEAQSYCREKYTDLATVHNMEDVNTLNDTVDLSRMKDPLTWIGLYNDRDSWRWSLSDRSFYRPGETEFRLWTLGQPNNYKKQQHCTFINPSGRWWDVSCEGSRLSICLDVRGLNVTFVLINIPMTWTEAQSYCRANYTDLASVRNMAESQKIQDLVPYRTTVWIGLSRDFWKWSDGSNSTFSFWEAGEPNNNYGNNEACVVAYFNSSGQWGDVPCGRKYPFICYSPLPKQELKLFKLKVKTSSSVDLDDPAVLENMLLTIKQKLKGLDENIQVNWKKQPDGKVFYKEKKTKEEEKTKEEL